MRSFPAGNYGLWRDIEQRTTTGKRIVLSGDLDSDTAPQLQQLLTDEITSEVKTVILDMKGLEFLSSAGLRVIFKLKKDQDGSEGRMHLVNVKPQVRKVFEIIKALDGMSVFRDDDELDSYLEAMQKKVLDGE